VPLRLAWPAADVPVVQVALPDAAPEELLKLGAALRPLREEGVLLVASGGVVHNLGRVDFGPDPAPEAWAVAFDAWVRDRVEVLDAGALARWRTEGPHALLAHPTPEHLDPIFVALGARADGDRPETIYEGIVYGNLSMRSFVLRPGGPPAAPTRSAP
jgi:4,5-DOPA dioxygenase extradiol